jgi:hypothetical protein
MLFPSFGPPITQEDIAKMGEDSAKTLQSRLDKGDTYLFFSNGLELSFGRMKGAKDLQLMCQVLASDRNKESKLAILQRMGILPVGNDQLVASLLTDFHVTEQLALRIKEKTLVALRAYPKTLFLLFPCVSLSQCAIHLQARC